MMNLAARFLRTSLKKVQADDKSTIEDFAR